MFLRIFLGVFFENSSILYSCFSFFLDVCYWDFVSYIFLCISVSFRVTILGCLKICLVLLNKLCCLLSSLLSVMKLIVSFTCLKLVLGLGIDRFFVQK